MKPRFLLALAAALLGGGWCAQAAQLACDPAQSRIEVIVKATVDSFTGRLAKFEPSITLAPDGRVTAASVRFHFSDVETGKEKRDKAMHEWQQTDRFPDGEFLLESLTPQADAAWLARGRLTFHGHTQLLEFPVTVVTQGDVCAIDGEAVVDTRTFDLPVIRMMGLLKVDPLVHVRFHLQGRKKEAA
ncbi:YceI family protein [Oleiharenicola lentus]|jgi:polyisoprenoid-binding protein YceI|uniref:YceI family protein n=1 Tax=Oleiharenicola lentus TaxID=2508720 RepID=A0A4Q1C3G5_9BACT|nr:YceI family protein [Oleiharenicola lentus]RXK52872.1 YceI family protein [Oleiharenicola lentus]